MIDRTDEAMRCPNVILNGAEVTKGDSFFSSNLEASLIPNQIGPLNLQKRLGQLVPYYEKTNKIEGETPCPNFKPDCRAKGCRQKIGCCCKLQLDNAGGRLVYHPCVDARPNIHSQMGRRSHRTGQALPDKLVYLVHPAGDRSKHTEYTFLHVDSSYHCALRRV